MPAKLNDEEGKTFFKTVERDEKMKTSTMGIMAAGMVAGMMMGAAGMAVKDMLMPPKSNSKKMITTALNSVGEMFTGLAKYTG